MGRSITCNFAVHVNFSDGSKVCATQTCYGAMNFRQVVGILLAEQAYQDQKETNKKQVLSAEVWPQTANGRRRIKGDYAVILPNGEITHKNIGMDMAA